MKSSLFLAATSALSASAIPWGKIAYPWLKDTQLLTLNDYQQAVVVQHSLHRLNHTVAALEWDDTLAQYAQNTAQKCLFQHDTNQGSGYYGQNLAAQTGVLNGNEATIVAGAITNQWYNGEINAYTYYGQEPDNSRFGDYGHVTQVVWKASTKVGCYTINCPAGAIFGQASILTVCNYGPPGNYAGEFAANVLPPIGNPTVTINT